MRANIALLAAAVLCLPATAAEAQLLSQSGAAAAHETFLNHNNPKLAHWDYWGPYRGWSGGQEMGLGYPEWGEQAMGWQHPSMGWDYSPQGSMGGGMPNAMMLPMMMAMADTNGDGALSREEHQAVHDRMFNFVDTNKDGKLTVQEVQTAFQSDFAGIGQPSPAAQPSTTGQPGTSTTGQPSTTNQ